MAVFNHKMILIYGFREDETKNLSKLVEDNKLPFVKVIKESMGNMQLSDIIDGKIFETFQSELPKEKVILFNNLTDEEINTAILAFKRYFDKLPILAAVTETSAKWTLKYLLEHLIEERNWYNNHN